MEGVAGGSGQEHRRLLELVGARPCHDPLVPGRGFRPAVRVVEQEQRGRQLRRQFQIARDGPLEGGTQVGQFVVDRVCRLGFIDGRDLLTELPASRRIDLAMAGLHGLERGRLVQHFAGKGLHGLQHSQMMTAGVAREQRRLDEFVDPAQHLGFARDVAGTDGERLLFMEGA